MPPYRVIIAGTRAFKDYELLRNRLNHLLSNRLPDVAIVSGCASNADKLGERYAAEMSLEVHRYPGEWIRYGKVARTKQNELMADNADACVLLWDGKSRNAEDMLRTATIKGLEIRLIRCESDRPEA
ncbi:SLOG family protein [Leptolyngbya sp. FACHB-8]|uniref:SLOG family protein n=1 Tax=unclassified Leptolyngbya TaxID=2650499 RepID=UPI001682FA01|nr:SLOG family protein [Leptolyngbya sp. FACHB-8]MBD1908973.1 DUF2493 domain-containing protein [Leptolyngbya sp. FACHB-8]